MSAAFQGNAFENNAFQVVTLTGPAFQANAFQFSPLAFQLAPPGAGPIITSMSMLTDPIDVGNVGVLPECV